MMFLGLLECRAGAAAHRRDAALPVGDRTDSEGVAVLARGRTCAPCCDV